MSKNHTTRTTYNTLEEIQIHKAMLLKDVQKDDNRIQNLWASLFRKPEALKKNAAASKRLNSLMATGVGFFDVLMLGWKLYRKFKR